MARNSSITVVKSTTYVVPLNYLGINQQNNRIYLKAEPVRLQDQVDAIQARLLGVVRENKRVESSETS